VVIAVASAGAVGSSDIRVQLRNCGLQTPWSASWRILYGTIIALFLTLAG
jgi:hypothetical protein